MSLREFYSNLKPTFASLHDEGSMQQLAALNELDQSQAELSSIFASFDNEGFGLTLVDNSAFANARWAVLLSDPSTPGKYRYQIFTASGFLSHRTFASVDEAIFDAYVSGFNSVAPRDTLDRVSVLPEWGKGMAVTAVIEDMHAGRMARARCLNAFKAIKAEEGNYQKYYIRS